MIVALVAFWASPSAAQYFTITSFHSDINIHSDGTVFVKEALKIVFEQPRHGIYREIPFKFRNELGDVTKTPIDVESVTNDSGIKWKYRVSHEGNVVNIRIGDADTYVEGEQTYIITYRVSNVILFLKDHDELYWNVTGNYWQAPISEASARVTLDTEGTIGELRTTCYTGYSGSQGADCNARNFSNGAEFQATRNLSTREGLTVVLGWPKGIVHPPTAWQKFLMAVNPAENWVILLPLIAMIAMFRMYWTRGRDPRVREALVVKYEPPDFNGRPLNAAEVGALIDERLDPRDLTGAIIGLAEKGYLKLEGVKTEGFIALFDSVDYKLTKQKDSDDQLSDFERKLMDYIFSDGKREILVSEMKNRFYRNLGILKSTLFADLVDKKYFTRNPESVRSQYLSIGVVIIIFGVFASLILTPDSVVKSIIMFGLSGLIVVLFAGAMPAKTREGALANEGIHGFQEFMNRADKDRLQRMGPEVFYKYMPYAIALDVVDHWSKAFADVFAESAAPPAWYVAPYSTQIFNPVAFGRSLGNVTSTLGTAMFSAPRGSGASGRSGGGGFSGGGFGGGGGGSW